MINVPKGLAPHEVDLYISAFKFCEKLIQEQNTDIGAAVTETTEKYSFIISDKELFAQFLFREITAYTEPSIGVVSPELDDKTWWSKLKKSEKFIPEYWQRYYDYLNRKPSWSLTAVQDIDSSTDEIMNALANPRSGRACDRMGMVFGYVQSGKTTHYIGLINKAVDAGYRIVVVLTGIHNSLRSQTQSRIDEEVLGYETSLENLADMIREPNVIGVGIGAHNRVKTIVQSITTRDEKGDVNKTTEGVSMVPPFIIVTKKNATVLRRILRFFRKNQCAEVIDGKKIITAKYPALIIDDEADQASINTNDSYDEKGNLLDDYNPTTINGLIREILKTFECRSYVGYTATPFANIFIPPHINSERYGTDLFPRDFVFRTPRADQYIGAREFFGLSGDENTPVMPLCRDIIAGASYLGKGTKAGDPVGNIPEELKKAVKCFLISTALRNCRGQINKPNTMLIHIVRFVSQQNAVKKKVAAYYQDELANFIRYGDSGIYDELKTIWENDYLETTAALRSQFSKYMSDCADIEWDDIWDEIRRIVAKKEIKIYSVNGKSEDALLYKNNEGNDVYHVKMERLSRSTYIPVAKGKPTDQWFYERARGQYLVELSRQPTKAAKDQFKSRCPKNRCISKTVAAKCVMAWSGYPYIVSKGLETNFVFFSDMVSKGEFPEPSEQSYIEMISRVILFNRCDDIIKSLKFGGFKAQQDYYTVALIGKYYSDLINPQEIWNNQDINAETAKIIETLAYFVWEHFQNPSVPGVNIGQWCKKEDCWELLQKRFEAQKDKAGAR